MNQLDRHYQGLLLDIMHNGTEKGPRNGKTVSVFGRQIRHKMKDGFPLLTTKKMYWKGIVTELLWFLRGDTNIKYLKDNDVHIWDGDAYKNYLTKGEKLNEQTGGVPDYYTQEEFINKIKTDFEFAKKWGELGPVYGKQWRSWDVPKILTIERGKIENSIGTEWGSWERNPIDQIANLIRDLRTSPDSRRLMVSAWNVGELDQMTLPPCHYGFQTYTRELRLEERLELWYQKNQSETGKRGIWEIDYIEKYEGHRKLNSYNIPKRAISLMWNQRSVDVPLGLPFNVASYGLLLEILAKMTNMVPDELIGNLGDCHIYENQLAGCREQIPREPFALPKLRINTEFWATSDEVVEYSLSTEILSMLIEDFRIEGYESHPAIKFPLSN
jgi:thymidylate synthase